MTINNYSDYANSKPNEDDNLLGERDDNDISSMFLTELFVFKRMTSIFDAPNTYEATM